MLSREVTIEQDVELNQVSFSIYNKVGAHSVIENSSFGRYSYCEPYAITKNTIIQNFVDIVKKCTHRATPKIPCNALRLIILPTGAEWAGVRDTDGLFLLVLIL